MFLATSTFSILRGESEDEYGDLQPTGEPVAVGIPMFVHEVKQRQYLPQEQRTTTVRVHSGRCNADVDIEPADRIVDEASGTTYIVDAVHKPASPLLTPDLTLDLRISS